MNILLVHPEFPDTFWTYTHALRLLNRKALLPPLGLLTVAAMLPPDWGKRLVDLNVRPLTEDDLSWADMVFISGMAVQRHTARKAIARCKDAGKIIVAGGPLFTGEYALFDRVDHFILNEAELTLSPFLTDLQKGCAKRVYRNREFADMSATPTPMWELADLNQYACVGVQFSRGCPYDCEFCNVTALLGRKPRTKSPAQIVAELDTLHRLGWTWPVFFVDDNLIGHRPAIKQLLPSIIEWQEKHGPIRFVTQASINLADDEKLTADMVRAGFDNVFVGIETPSLPDLAECGKSQNVGRDLVADVKKLQRAGIEVQAGFIVGFDNDDETIFRRQVDFIQESGIVTAMVGMLQAPPGTKLATRLRGVGRLVGYSTGDNTDGTTNIVPIMGLPALERGYEWLLKSIYSPGMLYRRIRTLLREYHPTGRASRVTRGELLIFARSLYQLGIVGPERFHYWHLLFWTILRRPGLLPVAVRIAICGHHYRKICELRGLMGSKTVTDDVKLQPIAPPQIPQETAS